VGESLFGVFLAGTIVSTGNDSPFGLVPEGSTWPAMLAGVVAFILLAGGLYAWIRRVSVKVAG